jgi:hypothetical protein
LIKQEGINGNYAFKNKYGMFIALAKTSIQYNKQEKHTVDNFAKSSLNSTLIPKGNQFWVIIHFT